MKTKTVKEIKMRVFRDSLLTRKKYTIKIKIRIYPVLEFKNKMIAIKGKYLSICFELFKYMRNE